MNYEEVINNAESVDIAIKSYMKQATASFGFYSVIVTIGSSNSVLFLDFVEKTELDIEAGEVFKMILDRQVELLG